MAKYGYLDSRKKRYKKRNEVLSDMKEIEVHQNLALKEANERWGEKRYKTKCGQEPMNKNEKSDLS